MRALVCTDGKSRKSRSCNAHLSPRAGKIKISLESKDKVRRPICSDVVLMGTLVDAWRLRGAVTTVRGLAASVWVRIRRLPGRGDAAG